MSKRFGRNQRRKLMEQRIRDSHQLVRLSQMLDHERTRSLRLESRIEDWSRRIREMLGEYSAFLSEPGQMMVQRFIHEMPARIAVSASPSDLGGYVSPAAVMDRITLSLFTVLCDEDIVKLSANIRFVQVRQGDGMETLCGHSIDGAAIYTQRTDEVAYFIGKQVARFLKESRRARTS